VSHSPVPKEKNECLVSRPRYAILDMLPEAAFDRLAALAARLFEVPMALVSLIDKDRFCFKAR
jgi:sigma-B regulation protein RsbU (phosphoserine phosphatase)